MREEVIGTLCATLRDVVDSVEEGLRDDVDTDIQDGEFQLMDMIVGGLMSLHAGTGPNGPERIALIERALAAEVLDERTCGTLEDILKELRGESVRPQDPGVVATE